MTTQPPLTDSPWFWFALFSGVGLVALVATGGKFGDRQAQVERKGQAHEAVVEGIDVLEEASGKLSVESPPDYSRPGHIHIHLGPLVTVIGAVCAGSLVILARERRLAARKRDS
jgi:hypothetical protein